MSSNEFVHGITWKDVIYKILLPGALLVFTSISALQWQHASLESEVALIKAEFDGRVGHIESTRYTPEMQKDDIAPLLSDFRKITEKVYSNSNVLDTRDLRFKYLEESVDALKQTAEKTSDKVESNGKDIQIIKSAVLSMEK